MADRNVKVTLSARVGDFVAGMKDAARETYAVSESIDKMQQRRDAMRSLGVAALGVGTAMTGMAVLAAKAAIDWESAWAGVLKTVDGTPEQLGAVEEGLRGLTQILPASHEEIAGVAEAAGQLGIQTGNVVAFTKTMIDLGETTNLTANDAATSLARFMNVMGTSQADVGRLGAALVGLGNNYATTESEILEMSMRLSGAGNQIKLSEGEVLGLATALSSVGIEAEAGGSAMSKVMIDIAASVEEGGDRLSAFAEVAGVSADSFAAKWRSNPGEALALFVQGLADAEAQGSSTLGILADLGITEVRMRDALLRAAGASDIFSEAMAQGNAEFESNNALTDEAAKRYETVQAKIQIAGNAINDAAISLGSVFLPAIAGVAEGIADLAGWFAELPAPLQGIIGGGTLAAGAIVGLGGAAVLALPKIIEFSRGLEALGLNGGKVRTGLVGAARFLTGPWGIAMVAAAAGITALKAGLDALGPSAEEMKNALTNAKSAADIWETAAQGKGAKYWANAADDIDNFQERLDIAIDRSEHWWKRFSDSNASSAFSGTLRDIGEQLGDISTTNLPAAQEAFAKFAEETDGSHQQLWALLAMMPEYRKAVEDAATMQGIAWSSMSDGERQAALLEVAMGGVGGAAEDAAQATEVNAEAIDELSGKAQDAEKDIESLADTIRNFGEAELNMREANRQMEAAWDDLTASIKDNGDSLDITTEKGRSNQSAIDDAVTSTLNYSASVLERTGSEEKANAVIARGREQLIRQLEQFGITGKSAERYADKLGLIPQKVDTAAELHDQKALRSIQNLKDKLNSLPDPTIDIYANSAPARSEAEALIRDLRNRSVSIAINAIKNFPDLTSANGNLVEYANGGGQFYGPGMYAGGANIHKFAEPETIWEAYISGKPDARDRNVGVWMQAGERLGAIDELVKALGSRSGGPMIGSVAIENHGPIDGAMDKLAWEMRRAERGGRPTYG